LARPSKSDLCEKCQKRLKHWSDGEQKKWCKVCIDLYYTSLKRQNWTDENFLRHIPDRFIDACIENLPEALQVQIKELPDDTGLLLWGAPGVGKTYAMAALMRKFLQEGFNCKRIIWEELCLQLRDTYKPNSKTTEFDIIRSLFEIDKLFIEDLGTTVSNDKHESDFSLRTFLTILDKRLEHCKATFITTNKPVEQLAESFDMRIASRLQLACVIRRLAGQDKRRQV
jgi:DNA replication protein DnaC